MNICHNKTCDYYKTGSNDNCTHVSLMPANCGSYVPDQICYNTDCFDHAPDPPNSCHDKNVSDPVKCTRFISLANSACPTAATLEKACSTCKHGEVIESPCLKDGARECNAPGFELWEPISAEKDPNGINPHAPGAKLDEGMSNQEFDAILQNRISKIRAVLGSKAKEYAQNGDRLFNFRLAGQINKTSMASALWGMATKHLISVMDLVEGRLDSTPEMVNEKIGDLINYLILLEAVLLEGKKNENH